MTIQHLLILACVAGLNHGQITTQDNLDKMAAGLRITYDVATNTKEVERFDIRLTLHNAADGVNLDFGPWAIRFTHVFPLEPDLMGTDSHRSVEVPGQYIELTHVEGSYFHIKPLPGFKTLAPGGQKTLKLKSLYWSVARTDVMGNWYMTSQNLLPKVIASTNGESLSFVTDKDTPALWKRYNYDEYNPYTPQERYDRNQIKHSMDNTELRVIPQPKVMTLGNSSGIQWMPIDSSWLIVYDNGMEEETNLLLEAFPTATYIKTSEYSGDRTSKVFFLKRLSLADSSSSAYTLDINVAKHQVSIIGNSDGVYYGVITFLSLWDPIKGMPECSIQDDARFEYRGVMLDISRNFHGKDEIIHLIKLMGRYKLNKLHLHLTDDEGWRLEIQSLPELTEVGSRRCHDITETRCLLPQLGSGPEDTAPGSGFLTSKDYRAILTEAVKHHVQVIPEFDMPGHARAAIKAMENRMRRLSKQGGVTSENDVTLTEAGDTSKYTTPQMFSDNAINPCLNSTYTFINTLMDEVINLHSGIQPLEIFHFGGDEVGRGAWVNSSTCQQLMAKGSIPGNSPKKLFFQRVSALAMAKGLSLAAWEDGLMKNGTTPYDLGEKAHPDMYAYSWDNVWEWGTTSRTNKFANNGYKVVMAHGTHLYFDHPYEPDPEERGYYWATRFTDTKKTFAYNAKDVYANSLTRRSGKPITEEEKCGEDEEVNCPALKKVSNIMGLQGSLFGETTRTKEQLYDRFFPRVLALAERAWHEAQWESLPAGSKNHTAMLEEDWFSFVRAVGHREIPRLEKDDVTYRIPPPGAKLSHGRLLTNALYPGLVVEYSLDMEQTWTDAGPLVFLGNYKQKVWLRTRSRNGRRHSRTVVLHPDPPVPSVSQPTIDYIATNVKVNIKVEDNYLTYGGGSYAATITLSNEENTTVPSGNWAIYFCSVQWIESEYLKKGLRYIDHDSNLYFDHVKGYLFKLGPTNRFKGLEGYDSLEIHLKMDGWSVSRYEQFPNWYVSATGMKAMDIVSTQDLSFVAPFTKPNQWKRAKNDQYTPWTPAARYYRNQNMAVASKRASPIIPNVVSYTQSTGTVSLTSDKWVIFTGDPSLTVVAEYLNETLTSLVKDVDFDISADIPTTPTANSIHLKLGQIKDGGFVMNKDDAYKVKVDAKNSNIEILASTPAGMTNGVSSLVQLALQPGKEGKVTGCDVMDWPRFEYRGMFADVARNFKPKESILKLLDAMALYKLNKFHFHLCDDEGWRLEIPGLPELTTVGSKRCHDLTETECVLSTLGSGAGSENYGRGFYTVEDYRDILRHAQRRQIQIIPEFDVPGHSHAAVMAMRARRQRLLDLGEPVEVAEEYMLDDVHDPSQYYSVQMYSDNAVNPCLESSYRFIAKILRELKRMHNDIQPLKIYHFGGDEVAKGAWQHSPACLSLLKSGVNLKEKFTQRVSALTSDLSLAAWEDGLMQGANPWERSEIKNKDVLAYIWDNVWEWGVGRRAYLLANAGYKVVLSPVTHTYFDHPNEPNPEERGFYWGTRYTDIFKLFAFMPEDYYQNIDVDRMGEKMTLKDVCAKDHGNGCPALKKKENIIGMQGQIWTETVRLPSQMDYMVFPRFLALAERAWHKASWEGKPSAQQHKDKMADMAGFAKAVSYLHLPLLEKLGIEYRVPPPGARQFKDTIQAKVEFPGLRVVYLDKNSQWRPLSDTTSFAYGQEVTLKTLSHDGSRSSSEVKVKMVGQKPSSSPVLRLSAMLVLIVCICHAIKSL